MFEVKTNKLFIFDKEGLYWILKKICFSKTSQFIDLSSSYIVKKKRPIQKFLPIL
jgi:hypothetical protein